MSQQPANISPQDPADPDPLLHQPEKAGGDEVGNNDVTYSNNSTIVNNNEEKVSKSHKTVKARPRASTALEGKKPIIIITATQTETNAVLHAFCPENEWGFKTTENNLYYFLGVHGGVPVQLVQSQMGVATLGGSLGTTITAIMEYHPRAVIMCGIAFGLCPEKQKIGDILISKQLQYYEPQKRNPDKQIPRGDKVTASTKLLRLFQMADIKWPEPKKHFGLILSGEKLVNDLEFQKELLEYEPEAIGVEMEGAGIYAGSAEMKVDWILVKAISEWANGIKSDEHKEEAAKNAAEFIHQVIDQGDWVKSRTRRSSKRAGATIPPHLKSQSPPHSVAPNLPSNRPESDSIKTEASINQSETVGETSGSSADQSAGDRKTSENVTDHPTNDEGKSTNNPQSTLIPSQTLKTSWTFVAIGFVVGMIASWLLRSIIEKIVDQDIYYLLAVIPLISAAVASIIMTYKQVMKNADPGKKIKNFINTAGGVTIGFTIGATLLFGYSSVITLNCSTLDLLNNPAEGGVILASPDPNCKNNTKYHKNTNVQLEVKPNQEYVIEQLIIDGKTIGNKSKASINMSAYHSVVAQFNKSPISCYSLSLLSFPNEGGTIEPDILPDCPTEKGKYSKGTHVTLRAKPHSPDFEFSHWSLTANITDIQVIVTMNADMEIKANFIRQLCFIPTFNTNPTEGGRIEAITQPNCGKNKYYQDSLIEVRAIPNDGFLFNVWADDASGETTPAKVRIDNDPSITANFSVIECFNLKVFTLPNGGGKVDISPQPNCGNNQYIKGTAIQLHAVENKNNGFHFLNWSDDIKGIENPVSLTIERNQLVTANFINESTTACHSLILSSNPIDGGKVEANPPAYCQGDKYKEGTEVQLTALPSPDYLFANWSGISADSSTRASVLMNTNRSATANFNFNPGPCYTLIMKSSPEEGGEVVANPQLDCNRNTQYHKGQVVELTAKPKKNFKFKNWSGGLGTTPSIKVAMNDTRLVTAFFEPIVCYKLTSRYDPGDGKVEASPLPDCPNNKELYNRGTVVKLTATANPGHVFKNWTGDSNGITSTIQVSMFANHSVNAIFEDAPCYKLDLIPYPQNGGTIEPSPKADCADGGYTWGKSVTLTAKPNTGFTFGSWSGGTVGSITPTQVTIDANKTVKASFNPIPCYPLDIKILPNDASGRVEKSPKTGCAENSYYKGTLVTLTAYPEINYEFNGWSGDASGKNKSVTVSMNAARSVTAEFYEVPCYLLDLKADPERGGTIISDPPFNCGPGKYKWGSKVKLTASPKPGYDFHEWHDAEKSTNRALTTTITITRNRSVTALFRALPCYSLDLAASPTIGGTVEAKPEPNCPSDNKKYFQGSAVEITAQPSGAFQFEQWNGSATGTSNPVEVIINSNLKVTASFAPACFSLTLKTDPDQGGTIKASSPPDCPNNSKKYKKGTIVELTALAKEADGYLFTNWEGDASGGTTQVSIAMTADRLVTAKFKRYCYALSFSADPLEGGVVIPSKEPNCPDEKTGKLTKYNRGTDLQLNAIPKDDLAFKGWRGDVTGIENPAKIKIESDISIIAEFAPPDGVYQLVITTNPSDGGTIEATPLPNYKDKWYTEGTRVSLNAQPSLGYEFSGWEGDVDEKGGNKNNTVTMVSNKQVKANFILYCYPLILKPIPEDAGSIQVTPAPNCPDNPNQYRRGTSVTLTANVNPGYQFIDWGGDIERQEQSITLVMDTGKEITANFLQVCFNLSLVAEPRNGGRIDADLPPDCTDTLYKKGTVITLTASPNAESGYDFREWEGALVGANNPGTVTITGNLSITARFLKTCFKLEYSIDPPTGGAVDASPSPNCEDDKYSQGKLVTLNARPKDGYKFEYWLFQDNRRNTEAEIQLTLRDNIRVTAVFKPVPCYHLIFTANPKEGGNVNVNRQPNCESDSYTEGTQLQLTATSNNGYKFIGWTGDETGGSSTITITMDKGKTVTGNFQIICYTLNYNADPTEGGQVVVNKDPDCGPQQYSWNTDVQLTAIASPGSEYRFDEWQGDFSGNNSTITIKMDADKTVVAKFTKITCYTLALAANPPEGGTIIPNPTPNCRDNTQYKPGTTVTLTAQPACRAKFKYWYIEDVKGSTNPVIKVEVKSDLSVKGYFDFCASSMPSPNTIVKNPARPQDELSAKPPFASLIMKWGSWLNNIFGRRSLNFLINKENNKRDPLPMKH